MTTPELRLWGDPFRTDDPSAALRQLVAAATAAGWRCGLSLSAAQGEADGRRLHLTDGARAIPIRTRLPDGEVAGILACAEQPVAATAPLVVYGDDDQVTQAGLEYPRASLVLAARQLEAVDVLARLDAHHRGWPRTDPVWSLTEAVLGGYGDLPLAAPGGRVLHVGSPDPRAGTDLAVRAAVTAGLPLTVLLPERDEVLTGAISAIAREHAAAPDLHIVEGPLSPARFDGCSAVLLPARAAPPPEVLLPALASGRVVLVSRFGETAGVLSVPGICFPIGGATSGGIFEPNPDALRAALDELVAEPERARSCAVRARAHVWENHRRGLPSPPVALAVAGERPVVVLEAPLLELSSSAVLTMETARALARRGHVDLRLVPVPPFECSMASWGRRAPDLLPLLCRRPPHADLWLSAGWPPRAQRPLAHTFALRVDWEYGALPAELTPVVTEEADVVVVHSAAVERVVEAAGRTAPIARIPHGVDGSVFHQEVPPSRRVLEFKADRAALLFVGGLIWRKGIDLLLSAWLGDASLRESTVLVIKSVGGDRSYAGYHLGALVDKVRRLGREVLLIDEELSGSELAEVYRACDLLVHPYRGEGFGMPVLEARACGLPVVVTRGGSTDDFCASDACVGIAAEQRFIDLPGAQLGRPWVLEPDAGAVRGAVCDALAALPDLRDVARRDAPGVRARFSWSAAAAALEQIAIQSQAIHAPVPHEYVGVGASPPSGWNPDPQP